MHHREMPLSHTVRILACAGTAAVLATTSPARADEASVGIAAAGPPPPAPLSHVRERAILLPAILAGTGVAAIAGGLTLVLTAPDVPSNCNADAKTCTQAPGQTAADFADTQDRAGRAHALPVVGHLTIGLGAMLVTAGLLTFLFGPDGRRLAAQNPVTPWAAPGSGGLRAGVRF
jgi:hypothetical protein